MRAFTVAIDTWINGQPVQEGKVVWLDEKQGEAFVAAGLVHAEKPDAPAGEEKPAAEAPKPRGKGKG